MQPAPRPPTFRIGPYVLDLRAGELRKQGARVRLQEKPLRVLAALAEQRGQIVTREELKKRLWPDDTFVDFETGLNSAVSRLRDALCDDAEKPRYIETIPRRGYRIVMPVEVISTGDGQREHAAAPTDTVWEAVAPLSPMAALPASPAEVAAPSSASEVQKAKVRASRARVPLLVAAAIFLAVAAGLSVWALR
ncbi:MAG TPA: winged helix-turn-helix domain-containing protein, partial [Candidatus Acidoferrales bacterium]|nr:winged helix-turn-helix domain-containing protein [Candidatus Acidoferrales bacterium]